MWDRTSLDYQHASDFKDGHVFAQSFPSFIFVWLSLNSSTCCNYEATCAKVVACKKGSASPKAPDIECVTSLSGWLFDSKSRSLFLCQVQQNAAMKSDFTQQVNEESSVSPVVMAQAGGKSIRKEWECEYGAEQCFSLCFLPISLSEVSLHQRFHQQ